MALGFLGKVVNSYDDFIASMPEDLGTLINLFLLVILLVVYVYFFIYKFYSFIGTKNVIGLDLSKYNKFEHATTSKVIGILLYFLEYILILPFLITFWFAIFAIFLMLLTKNPSMTSIFAISAAIVGAVRMTSFIPRGGQKAAKEAAKFIPITVLGIAVTTQGIFDFQQILSHLEMLPSFFNKIPIYVGFIVGLEVILRFFEAIFVLTGLYSEKVLEKDKPEEKEAKEE
ncbi:MAG TPA: hypothetical protein VJ912_04150, partial [Candidatus Nanoarchaeia archaeon]|nr:hypothetical protein [Candidatus Nanoarchaeia archaeon]